LSPYCEPQLGKRNLYRSTGGESIGTEINARLWVLNLSDGENTVLDIAERSGLPFPAINNAAELLCQGSLLSAVPQGEPSKAPTDGISQRELSARREPRRPPR
jgi:aminopeptidase-like protein